MMAAAMNPRAVAGIGDMFAGDVRIEQLIESHDGHAKRADEAEARTAAVIAVMRRMDGAREKVRAIGDFEGASRLAASLELLRVALGLPIEWRDGGEG